VSKHTKVFYKVYQDKESTGNRYYVDTLDGVLNDMSHWFDSHIESDEGMPVLEPVLMTQEQFDEIPEFEGY